MKFKKTYQELLKYYDPEKSEIKEILNFTDFSNKIVLDLGCGEGKNSIAVATKAKNVYGIDSSEGLIKICNEKKTKSGLKNIEFRIGKAEKIPFPNEFFDIVLITWAMHHFDDLNKALDEINRVLKKDGVFLFFEPLDDSEYGEIEASAKIKLNIKSTPCLGNFWVNLLTYLNKNGFIWTAKLFEPEFVFPNLEKAVEISPICMDFKVINRQKISKVLKKILKKYETKNGKVIFHDKCFICKAKRLR